MADIDAEELRYRHFLSQFDVLTIPACNVGMRLLLKFRDAQPDAYALASENHFGFQDDPAIRRLPEWHEFEEHCTYCDSCNAC